MHGTERIPEKLEHLLRAAGAESRRHRAEPRPARTAFEMRGQEPLNAARVDDARLAIAVRLIHRRIQRRRPRRNCAPVHLVDVLDVDMHRRRDRLPLPAGVSHLDNRVADAHLRMHHRAAGRRHAPQDLGIERLLQERDQVAGAVDDEIRAHLRDRGNGSGFHRKQLSFQTGLELGMRQLAQIGGEDGEHGQLRLHRGRGAAGNDRIDQCIEPFDEIPLSHDSFPSERAASAAPAIEAV